MPNIPPVGRLFLPADCGVTLTLEEINATHQTQRCHPFPIVFLLRISLASKAVGSAAEHERQIVRERAVIIKIWMSYLQDIQ